MAIDVNNKPNSNGFPTETTTDIHSTSNGDHPSYLNQPIPTPTAKGRCPPEIQNQNQNDFHEITSPLSVTIADPPNNTPQSILKTSTAYKAALDEEMQQYDDKWYAAQDAEDEDMSPNNDYMEPSAANFLLAFDFDEDQFDEISNTENITTENITNEPTIINTAEPSSHNNNNNNNNNDTITTNIIKVESNTEHATTKNELNSSNNNTDPITEPPTQTETNTTDKESRIAKLILYSKRKKLQKLINALNCLRCKGAKN